VENPQTHSQLQSQMILFSLKDGSTYHLLKQLQTLARSRLHDVCLKHASEVNLAILIAIVVLYVMNVLS